MRGSAIAISNWFYSYIRCLQLGDNLEPIVVVDKLQQLQSSCKNWQGCFTSDSLCGTLLMN